MSGKKSVFDIVTEQVVALLEAGTVPWRQPWTDRTVPRSIWNRPYRGVNVFLLRCQALAHGYQSPFWVTFKEMAKRGGRLKEGQRSTPSYWWKWTEREVELADGSTKIERSGSLRYTRVFNSDQIEGLDVPEIPGSEAHGWDPIVAAEDIAAGYPSGPTVRRDGSAAFYLPGPDHVVVPPLDAHHSPESFYSTLFHELAHSTGHRSRLDRHDPDARFGNHVYGREELVAEMGAAFLLADAGIESPEEVEQSAAYLRSWVSTIQEDRRAVMVAAGQAQKAADLVLDRAAAVRADDPVADVQSPMAVAT